jgi:hypothetical protein
VRLSDAETIRAPADWPAPLGDQAFHGPVGAIVRALELHTEADPAAILLQLLVASGNLIGRGPFFGVEADRHYTNLFCVLVGETAKGRKGTAWGHVRRPLGNVDSDWTGSRVLSGLSSGEGVIWAVRDPIMTREAAGHEKARGPLQPDAGVADKRLLVHEPEFAGPLRVLSREGNTLSSVLRQSWDTGDLRILTKNNPVNASGAHISIVGHITREELRRYLSDTEAANGFGNRFLWACCRRSKLLPEGGRADSVDLGPEISALRDAVWFSREARQLSRDDEARDLWCEVYPDLSSGASGLFGAVTSRAEAQVARLSCLYAALDASPVILAPHLCAALEVWRYCEDSCRYIFGEALGNRIADQIMAELQARPEGLTRTEIRDLFGRHRRADVLDRALNVIAEEGLAGPRYEQTEGRPVERWVAQGGNDCGV